MSVQKQDHPSIKVVITGISGCGKTTLLEKLIRRTKWKWAFVYDHKDGDFARRFKVKPCIDLAGLEAAVLRGGLVVYDPRNEFPGRKAEGFQFFCEFVWEMVRELRGQKIFIADELQDLCDENSKPAELCAMLDSGRTYQIDAYVIAQAMNGVHNQVRKQFTEIFVFMQGDANGKKWPVKDRGFSEIEIDGLKHGEWLYANTNTGERAKGGAAFVPKNAKRDLRGL